MLNTNIGHTFKFLRPIFTPMENKVCFKTVHLSYDTLADVSTGPVCKLMRFAFARNSFNTLKTRHFSFEMPSAMTCSACINMNTEVKQRWT